jgi:hypothetical protein
MEQEPLSELRYPRRAVGRSPIDASPLAAGSTTVVPDEFSHLFLAKTFLLGRLGESAASVVATFRNNSHHFATVVQFHVPAGAGQLSRARKTARE